MNIDNMDDDKYLEGLDAPARKPLLDADSLKVPLRRLGLRDSVSLLPTVTVREAIECMRQKHLGCVLVTEDEKIVGIFTERDVLNRIVLRADTDPDETLLGSVMTASPETLTVDDTIAWAINGMCLGGYRHIPVCDDAGRPIQVVSMRDIGAYIADFFPEEIANLPPTPGHFADSKHGG